MTDAALPRLERALGYAFTCRTLLCRALTHRSAARDHNERLEFLGDAVVGMVAAELLYVRFPDFAEGPLTRARARLVCRESLALIARELTLGQYLNLGSGELKSGGRNRDSMLADALEAVIGAVFLDGGMPAAKGLVQRLLEPRLAGLDVQHPSKDAKTRLQEYLQARAMPLPAYTLAEVSGSSHAQTFVVSLDIAPLDVTARGEGSSRRQAEQMAADQALRVINEQR